MPPAAPIEPPFPESSSVPSYPDDGLTNRWLGDLRGVLWRIDLGILPSSPTSSVDHLRQVTANSRRRYAALRRRLLIDPQVLKDGSSSPHLVMDNPLSQNPDSMWSRFFRNAELERMLDQDLSRLYPEHGSYFQTPGCQGMLRRILLLWCLRHPDYGYRQGMHELLAPLLYVLHVDIEHLSEVRKLYEDHFTDKFDGFSFHESDLTYKFDFKKFSDCVEDETGPQKSPASTLSPNELDPKIQAIISLCDAYGAEGELGVVVSEKFMEHDAYCMFDALMNGAGGAVAMAEFFSHSPFGTQHTTGLPPVIEASSALYHLLSIVDSSLHSHLVELGVEPQYFALRWLRVLFGREFALEDLLIIWDEIFASDNSKILAENDVGGVLYSSRGAFISALAVSMILHLRSSLLATENATSCLQRLLNFPEDIKLEKLIAKAKSLQGLALNANNSTSLLTYTSGGVRHNPSKPVTVRGHTLSSDSVPERIFPSLVPESYWEEKWRVLHKEEERSKVNSLEKKVPNRIKGWSEKVKLRLSRTESDPSPSKVESGKGGEPRSSVRRSLLKDLARQLGDEENVEDVRQREDGVEEEQEQEDNGGGSSNSSKNLTCSGCLNGNNGGSEENSSIFSDPPSPIIGGATNDHENESERSSVASNLYVDENFVEQSSTANSSRSDAETEALQGEEVFLKSEEQKEDSTGKSMTNLKDRKILLGKFQWLWKFGRNAGEGTSEKGGGTSEATSRASNIGRHNEVGSSTADGFDCGAPSVVISSRGGDAVDQNVKVTFKNLGQSMLENIQVIESALQQDEGQAGGALGNYSKNGGLVGRGQVTAMAALKELRKISNLLYEM